MLLAALAATLLATAYKARIDTWGLTDLVNADRYFFIAKILLVWFLAAFAVTSRGWVRAILIVILFLPVIANGQRFIYPQSPDYRWRDYCPSIERGEPTRVPILPAGFSFLHPGRHNH